MLHNHTGEGSQSEWTEEKVRSFDWFGESARYGVLAKLNSQGVRMSTFEKTLNNKTIKTGFDDRQC